MIHSVNLKSAWILATGSELTRGQLVDTNSVWLARELAGLGVETKRFLTLPDDREALCAGLCEAAAASDVVVLTGGLGPTADDLTREVFANVAGQPLVLHEESLAQLEAYFAERGREMPGANRVQAMLPGGATPLPNDCGTAPGFHMQISGCQCFALPGVPYEMKRMFARCVAPQLAAGASGAVLLSRTLNTCGLPEAEVGRILADWMAPQRNPQVGLSAEHGILRVRLTAADSSRGAAETSLDEAEHDIRARLGDAIYGRDDVTLAHAIGALLTSRNQTVCTAESCTGGLIAAELTEVPGSSRYFLGAAVCYADPIKQKLLGVPETTLQTLGAVSAETAAAMATGARDLFGADYALSVTGIAGPTGGTPTKPVGLVYLGLASLQHVETHELRLGAETPRDVIRLRTVRAALNLLRLRLLAN